VALRKAHAAGPSIRPACQTLAASSQATAIPRDHENRKRAKERGGAGGPGKAWGGGGGRRRGGGVGAGIAEKTVRDGAEWVARGGKGGMVGAELPHLPRRGQRGGARMHRWIGGLWTRWISFCRFYGFSYLIFFPSHITSCIAQTAPRSLNPRE